MSEEFLFRHPVSLAVKSAEAPPFGRGFNCWVEAAVRAPVPGNAQERVRAVLSLIDHKSLGLDVNLGFDPALPSLAHWILMKLQEDGLTAVRVRLERGDGFSVTAATGER